MTHYVNIRVRLLYDGRYTVEKKWCYNDDWQVDDYYSSEDLATEKAQHLDYKLNGTLIWINNES
jgi:hypothetical protein